MVLKPICDLRHKPDSLADHQASMNPERVCTINKTSEVHLDESQNRARAPATLVTKSIHTVSDPRRL